MSDAAGPPTEGASPERGRAFGASADAPTPRRDGRRRGTGRRGRPTGRRRALTIGCLTILALMLAVHAFLFETFSVPSGSMEPTYHPGDRIIVAKRHGAIHRGDVIVFSGEGSLYQGDDDGGARAALDTAVGWLGFRPGERDYLKRVIGVGGDLVAVDAQGRLRINGHDTNEPYLPRGRRASATPFSVRVPQGSLFVMGDNRDASDDSRNHLGDPGGGFVPASAVIGTVAWRY